MGDHLVAEWPGVARLTCARDGSEAVLTRVTAVAEPAEDTLESASVRALLRDLAGHLALHASAVAIDGRAVLFLGQSGAGKSTAAAEMCLRHRAQMLADDTALLQMEAGRVEVLPSEALHALNDESCVALGMHQATNGDESTKAQVPSSRVATAAHPLAAIFVLRFTEGSEVARARPLRGTEVVEPLLSSVIRFDVEDAQARRRDFEQLATLYERVPVFELARPAKDPGMIAVHLLDTLGQTSP
ncbi:MAG TPA: hypothetical protein VGM06_25805 [Polyangiaceae bacterium]|jgi:hypothetical protein